MTYSAPQLTLIGNATGIVLPKVTRPFGLNDHIGGSVSYDSTALLETEW